MEIILVDVIIIMAHFAEVENVAKTFFEPCSVDSFELNFGLGLDSIVELILDFFPVLFIVLNQFDFLGLFYCCNKLLHFCPIYRVFSFNFSLFYQSKQVSSGSFIVVEFVNIRLLFLFVEFIRVEKNFDFFVILFAFFVLFLIVDR
jgi:hypothetical protein